MLESEHRLSDGCDVKRSRHKHCLLTKPDEESRIVGNEISGVNHPTILTREDFTMPAYKFFRGLKVVEIGFVVGDDKHFAHCLKRRRLRPLRLHSTPTVGFHTETIIRVRLQTIYQVGLRGHRGLLSVEVNCPTLLVARRRPTKEGGIRGDVINSQTCRTSTAARRGYLNIIDEDVVTSIAVTQE